MPSSPPGALPSDRTGLITHQDNDAHRPLKIPRTSFGSAIHPDDFVQHDSSVEGNPGHCGNPVHAASGADATTNDLASFGFVAQLTSAVTSTPLTLGHFACERIARAFGQEGASKQPLSDGDASPPAKLQKKSMSRSVLSDDPSSSGLFAPCRPDNSCSIGHNFVEPASGSISPAYDEASRPHKTQRRAMSSSSDTQPLADMLPVSASLSLPTPTPGMPAPACLLPASHSALTIGQVCTQLGNDQHFFGIAPEQSVCERSSVQLTTPEAVGGPPAADSSISQCTISVELHANSVIPSSSVATCPAACAAFAPVPATPAHLCPLPGHFSLQHLPAATGRPLGSSADVAVSPGLRL